MNRSQPETSVGLSDLLRFLYRGLLPAILAASAAGVAAYQLSGLVDAEYVAETTVLVARSTGDFSQFGLSSVTAPPIDVPAYQAAGVSDSVLIEALQDLGMSSVSNDEIRSLRNRITVMAGDAGRDSSLLRVQARGGSPDVAAERANAVSEAMVAWDRRRASESLGRATAALEEQIAGLTEQIRSLQTLDDASTSTQIDGLIRLRADQQQQLGYARALVASAEGRLSILQPAGTTPRQIAPRPVLAAVIVATLAIGMVYGLLLLRNALTQRLRTAEDVADATGLPVLAQFAQSDRDDHRLREMTSYLRTSLLSLTADSHPRVFLVTSAHEKEGKSLVASKLAEALARGGYRTLLADADLRAPSVARSYGVSDRRQVGTSMRDWLTDASDARSVVTMRLSDDVTLDLVPQYRATDAPAELLGRGFVSALRVWEETYDAIVVDSAPVRAVADSLIIAPHCSGTVLVTDRRRTDRRALIGAVGLLQRVGVRILGVVLNREADIDGASAYGYGYAEPVASPTRRGTVVSRVKVSEHPVDGD